MGGGRVVKTKKWGLPKSIKYTWSDLYGGPIPKPNVVWLQIQVHNLALAKFVALSENVGHSDFGILHTLWNVDFWTHKNRAV